MSVFARSSAWRHGILVFLLAMAMAAGCSRLEQFRQEASAPNITTPLGVSPAARAIESSLGVD